MLKQKPVFLFFFSLAFVVVVEFRSGGGEGGWAEKAAIRFAPAGAMQGALQSGQYSHCDITAVRELNQKL